MKSEEGEDFGPVPREELDAWHAEGRITADCQLLCEGTGQWQWAADVYADLSGEEPAPAVESAPRAPPSKQKGPGKQKSPVQPNGPDKLSRKTTAAPEDDLPPSTRSRMVAGLLGIFLGPLGTHRFYLGYWVLGLVMLATGGGCGIWSLIDAVLVFLGKVPDADGRRLS